MQTLESRIVAIMYGLNKGSVFTPKDFASLGDPRTIGMALTRLSRKGTIRRLTRGLYDYPRSDPQLGILKPTPDAIARALAGRDAIRIQSSGAYAANLLGLSDQVPMRIVFLSDGSSRNVQIGKLRIQLKRTTPRNMATAGKISGLVIQALRHVGQKHVDDAVINRLKMRLSDDDKKQLRKDMRYAPAWIAEVMRNIAANGEV